jgi:cell division protein FtsA
VVRNPIYSTGAGLLLYARDNALAGNRGRSITGNARSMAERMKNWFQGNF